MAYVTFSVLLLVASICLESVRGGCYFPLEFQGEFLTQSMTSREIAYSSVSILFDSIPSWGSCHRRLGHHVILKQEEGDEHNNNNATCFKCYSIVSRSPNVLQIHTSSNSNTKCFSGEEEARQHCPSQQQIKERKADEMMLYKTRGFYGGSAITKTYCPLNGRYKFTYSINDGTEDDLECQEPLSEASDCPTGYKFDLHFRGCSFPNFDMSFQCLASWPGENGETYMSLLDTKLPQLGEEARPRYRCALFKEDPDTGLTHAALSSDSTCVHHLYSAQDGFETLHLEKQLPQKQQQQQQQPHQQQQECIFPDWMQGRWEGLTVSGGEMTYRDEVNFVTHRGKCLHSTVHTDRFVVHLNTDCGPPAAGPHFCALFQQRDVNVMEFQLGVSSSDNPDASLCNAENFSPSKWLTLGRTHIEEPPHCPLVGEFSGVLPDAEGLCAKSYADCNNPEVMFYTVFNCHNQSEVYEEREYRCFGQWEEDGLVYTYTERKDIPGNECFVGLTIDEERNVVTEAGQNCERGHQPDKYGMTLHRQATCSSSGGGSSHPSDPEDPAEVTSERPVSPRLLSTTTPKDELLSTTTTKKHHKHQHHSTTDSSHSDVETNEVIPGSASPSSSSSSAAAGQRTQQLCSLVLVLVAILCQRTLLSRVS